LRLDRALLEGRDEGHEAREGRKPRKMTSLTVRGPGPRVLKP
jgi:hypothetical protein